MGHGELVRHLIGTASTRKEEILAEARAEAGRRIARARLMAEAMERESRETLAREIDREREIRLGRARRDARAVEIRARAKLAEEILSRLRERLGRLPAGQAYPQLLERLLHEILPELPPGEIVLAADSRAPEALAPLLDGRSVRFESLRPEEIGGVEASDEAGSVRIRNTLAARLTNAYPALLAEIHRRLEEGDE